MATVKVRRIGDEERGTLQTAKQTWYLGADGKPTTDVTKARQRLTQKGVPILHAIATEHGFVNGDIPGPKAEPKEKAEANPEPKAETKPKPAENKKTAGAKENKSE